MKTIAKLLRDKRKFDERPLLENVRLALDVVQVAANLLDNVVRSGRELTPDELALVSAMNAYYPD